MSVGNGNKENTWTQKWYERARQEQQQGIKVKINWGIKRLATLEAMLVWNYDRMTDLMVQSVELPAYQKTWTIFL